MPDLACADGRSENGQQPRRLSTCRDAFLFEDCVEDSPIRNELTHETVQAVDGWIDVPDRPGLGVTLNEEVVAKLLVDESV